MLGISLGLEAGQQAVLLPLFGLRQAVGRYAPRPATQSARLAPAWQRVGSLSIAGAGLYYLGQAVAALL